MRTARRVRRGAGSLVPDGRYSHVDLETAPKVDVAVSEAQTVASWRGVRMPAVVLTTAITAAASIVGTYLATHKADQPADCASRGDMNAVQKQVSDLADAQRTLTQTISHNADTAHNEVRDVSISLQSIRDALAIRQRFQPEDTPVSNALRGK